MAERAGQLCFLRDGSLATEPPNLYHCHSYLHYTDHTCLAEWANLLQHDLPGRNVFGIDLPFFRFQAGYRYVQMQWVAVCVPAIVKQPVSMRKHTRSITAVTSPAWLYRQMPAGSHPIYTQKNKQGGNTDRPTGRRQARSSQILYRIGITCHFSRTESPGKSTTPGQESRRRTGHHRR